MTAQTYREVRAMSDPNGFDETLISGYIDGELTQGDAQRVRIHLEDCVRCRATAEGMRRLREATMTSEFKIPEDMGWDERPTNSLSGWLRRIGWITTGVWITALIGYLLWLLATDADNWFEAALGFALFAGAALLFLSVLIDRMRTRTTDPYRKVEK